MIRPVHYCPTCGSAEVSWRVPADDNRERHVCEACGEIHYQNPRNVAGCICEHDGRVLLCRRAIEPRLGFWTVPAGFMENRETLAEAAARETEEEARAATGDLALYTVFNLPHISQVYVMFRAAVPDGVASPGPESLEVAWFDEAEVPWDELAFPVVRESLALYFADRRAGRFPVRMGDIHRGPDGGYEVRHRRADGDWQ